MVGGLAIEHCCKATFLVAGCMKGCHSWRQALRVAPPNNVAFPPRVWFSAHAVFPVYFKTAVHLSPATTNAVLATTPLFLAPFSFVARYLGRHIGAHLSACLSSQFLQFTLLHCGRYTKAASDVCTTQLARLPSELGKSILEPPAGHSLWPCAGRIQTIILFESIGVSTMAYMGIVTSSWTVLPLIIPLYLARSTANNSVYALQAAITMDYVPKSARGKWNRCRPIDRRICGRHLPRHMSCAICADPAVCRPSTA